jgi:hypothetical protein
VGPEHAHVEASGVGNNGVLHEVADRAQSGHRRAGGGKRHLPACHCLRATFRAPVSPARLNTSYALIDSASGNVWVANTVGSKRRAWISLRSCGTETVSTSRVVIVTL